MHEDMPCAGREIQQSVSRKWHLTIYTPYKAFDGVNYEN